MDGEELGKASRCGRAEQNELATLTRAVVKVLGERR
jgi:hypothetical protein